MFNFKWPWGKKKTQCPGCMPGTTFPDDAKLQMCSKCTVQKLDFHMFFNTTTKTSFMVVSYAQK